MVYTPEKPIVLVGIMGAGKTTVGRRLARKLSIPFKDSDKVIEDKAGMSIAEIFETLGEKEFRRMEKETIAGLLKKDKPIVLATGGGAFLDDETRAMILENSISVWLRADLEVLVERVSRKKNRPILERGDKRQILSKLIEERYPIYKEAEIVVDSGQGPHYKIVDEIIWKL